MTVMHVDANSAYLSWTAVDLLEKGISIGYQNSACSYCRESGRPARHYFGKVHSCKEVQNRHGEKVYTNQNNAARNFFVVSAQLRSVSVLQQRNV